MNEEEWRSVVGYEGTYSVSSFGRIRRDKPGSHTRVGHILKPSINRDGYLRLVLYQDRVARSFCIHQLVTPAFHGPRPEGLAGKRPLYEPNHIDGNKLNNHADNLEWTTRSANVQHSFDNGLQISLKGEALHASKLTDAAVREIRVAKGTQREIAKRYGVSRRVIYNVQNRLSWTHVKDCTCPSVLCTEHGDERLTSYDRARLG